jgi:hypothetical protein
MEAATEAQRRSEVLGLSRAGQLQVLQHQVASAALSGAGADEIERCVIAPSGCSEKAKAALWLYAFSFLSRFDQRRIAFDRLSEVSADDHPAQSDRRTT